MFKPTLKRNSHSVPAALPDRFAWRDDHRPHALQLIVVAALRFAYFDTLRIWSMVWVETE